MSWLYLKLGDKTLHSFHLQLPIESVILNKQVKEDMQFLGGVWSVSDIWGSDGGG
jgi:hypothetical protein